MKIDMNIDIFQFWSQVGHGEKKHPRDRDVLSRVSHQFNLRCLPGCFMGPLRTAPVVLLYLSPGWHESDIEEAKTRKGRDRHHECRKGYQPLPGPEDHHATWQWWSTRTAVFGEWDQLRSKIAVLNICGYHSKSFEDHPLLAALPSSRVSLEWAHTVLFPQAIAGERIVVCLRAKQYWGLGDRPRYGKALFAPAVTPAGHMHNGKMRRYITDAVRTAIVRDSIGEGEVMSQGEKEYIAELQRHATATRSLLSNAQKPERERMVVRAFLRCIGEHFSDDEICASKVEPVDVAFRTARFQVRDFVGDRKRGRDWREREQRYQSAQRVSDLVEPWTTSKPMSFDEVSQVITEGLATKASRYGVKNCSEVDALVYVDIKDRHLWPSELTLNDEVAKDLGRQGWRSVSMLFVPYGAVLVAQPDAPSFLRDKAGHLLKRWPHLDGWFEV